MIGDDVDRDDVEQRLRIDPQPELLVVEHALAQPRHRPLEPRQLPDEAIHPGVAARDRVGAAVADHDAWPEDPWPQVLRAPDEPLGLLFTRLILVLRDRAGVQPLTDQPVLAARDVRRAQVVERPGDARALGEGEGLPGAVEVRREDLPRVPILVSKRRGTVPHASDRGQGRRIDAAMRLAEIAADRVATNLDRLQQLIIGLVHPCHDQASRGGVRAGSCLQAALPRPPRIPQRAAHRSNAHSFTRTLYPTRAGL